MNALVNDVFSNSVAQRVGWALIHFVWQGAAVALLLALVLQCLRRRSPQIRWAASCVALALMMVLPVVTACLVSVDARTAGAGWVASPASAPALLPQAELPDLGAPEFSAVGASTWPAEDQVGEAAMSPRVPWRERLAAFVEPSLSWIVLVWLVGVLALSVWYLGGWWQLARTKRSGTRPVEGAVAEAFGRLMGQLGVSRPVRLLESARVAVPVVVGWLRPVILFPASVLSGFTPEQLEAVLAHELAHIRRYDCLVRIIQAAVETLLFYHPAVWWVSGRIRQESEHCCDELAVEVCGDRRSYARALARVAELGRRKPQVAPAASGGNLLDRIRSVISAEGERKTASSPWLAGISTCAVVLVLAAGPYVRARVATYLGESATQASEEQNVPASAGGRTGQEAWPIEATPPGEYALAFDGSNDFVEVPDNEVLDVGGEFTVEAWVNVRDTANGGTVVSKYTIGNGYRLGLVHQRSKPNFGYLQLTVGNGEHPVWTSIGVTRTNGEWVSCDVEKGRWTHVAASWNQGNVCLFVDGEEIPQDTSFEPIPRAPVPLLIGLVRQGQRSEYFDGRIAEVRIWNVSRSQEEIRRDVTTLLSGNEPGLVAYWPLEKGSGQIAAEISPRKNHGRLGVSPGADGSDPKWVRLGSAVPMLETYAGKSIEEWMQIFVAPGDGSDASDAVRALAEIGRPAVGPLVKALRTEDESARIRAAAALGEMGQLAREAVPALSQALREGIGEAAVALGRIGPEAAAGVPALIEALGDPHRARLAIRALGSIGPAAKDAVPALAERLEHKDKQVVIRAHAALARITGDYDTHVPFLAEALKSEDRDSRAYAAQALSELGPPGRSAQAALQEATGDEHPAVREWAWLALATIRSAQTVERFVWAALRGDDEAALESSSGLPSNSIKTQAEPVRKLAEMNPRWHFEPATVVSTPAIGFVVGSTELQGPGLADGRGSLCFTLKREDGRWQIVDIDFETQEGIHGEIDAFLERHPGARIWRRPVDTLPGAGMPALPGKSRPPLAFGPVIERVVKDDSVGEAMLLTNERVVFSADDVFWLNDDKIAPWLMVRLSPNGAYLLHARVHKNEHEEPGARASYALFLRDVVTRKDVRVPVPPYPDGWQDVCIGFNPFDQRGERMAIMALRGPRETEVILFDIADGKVSATGIKGRFAFARFDRTGRRLIGVQDSEVFVATLPSLERTRLDLSLGGRRTLPNSACPTADVICLYQVRGVPGERRGTQAIALYDFEAREKIADLPTHEENSQLDDLETQWTPDGRYVCYYDLADGLQGRIRGTRVWDRVVGKEKAFVEDAAPIGPGPAGSYIFLVRTRTGDHRPILYDASTGRSWELGDASMRLLHGTGRKIAYVKTAPDGKRTVCVAEIPIPSRTP